MRKDKVNEAQTEPCKGCNKTGRTSNGMLAEKEGQGRFTQLTNSAGKLVTTNEEKAEVLKFFACLQ